MTTKTEERLELSITRTFNAPVALVYDLWTSSEKAIAWWGPKDFVTTHLEIDFRVGGAYRACIENPDYGVNWMAGHYVSIEPQKKIVFTFQWERKPGEEPSLETLVTVTFKEENGKTVQTFHQTPFANAESRDSHIGGWTTFIDRQQAHAEKLAMHGARA